MFKEKLKEYDETSVFVCEWCRGKAHRIIRIFDLIKENNREESSIMLCRFCEKSNVKPFKSISDCINHYKTQLKSYQKRINMDVSPSKENLKQKRLFKLNIEEIKNLLRQLDSIKHHRRM